MNPLDQLRDIHLPGAVEWWPIAIGWWIVAALLLTIIVAIVVFLAKRKRQRKMVNAAIESLKTLEANTELGEHDWLIALSTLLRQIAINVHGRKAAAGLVGNQWLEYLDQHIKNKGFTEGIGKVLANEPYQEVSHYDRKALSNLVRQWVKSQTKQSGQSLGADHA